MLRSRSFFQRSQYEHGVHPCCRIIPWQVGTVLVDPLDNRASVKLVNVLSPAPRDAWEKVFRSDPFALESQSPAWADALCAVGGFTDVSRLYETADGRELVLPLLRRSFVGRTVAFDRSNPPDSGVCGPLAEGGTSAEEFGAVLNDLGRRRVLLQGVSPNPLLAPEWASAVPASVAAPANATAIAHRAHMLDLTGGWEEVWTHRFRGQARTGARRAERAGVTIECGTSGRLVMEFYQLLEQAATRWARLQHEPRWLALRRLKQRDPLEKLEAIARSLGERCRVWMTYVDGEPATGMMVLQGTNAYDFRAAMDERFKTYRCNDLLLRQAIEDACNSGCRYFYLGDSGESVPLARFKERFGAKACPYTEYRFERLPISRAEHAIKNVVKRVIGFKD
jgi:hypothetical protein